MKTIKHSLHFTTEVDETHPIASQLLSLDEITRTLFLEDLLKQIFVEKIQPIIDEVNEGNSWAVLKVVE